MPQPIAPPGLGWSPECPFFPVSENQPDAELVEGFDGRSEEPAENQNSLHLTAASRATRCRPDCTR